MGALLTVFSGPWAWAARLSIYAALVAAIFGFGWVKGDEHGTEKLTEYVGKQAKQAASVVVKQGAVTEKVVDHYHEVAGKTKTVTVYVDLTLAGAACTTPPPQIPFPVPSADLMQRAERPQPLKRSTPPPPTTAPATGRQTG